MHDPGQKVFFHGGAPGLRVGDWIRPASQTGVRPTNLGIGYSADSVSVTPFRDIAVVYAGGGAHGGQFGGDVYRVEPEGLVRPDPDFRGLAFLVSAAKVVGIVRTGVDRRQAAKVLGLSLRSSAWDKRFDVAAERFLRGLVAGGQS